MFDSAARTERRHRDREQRRAAANRRIGYDMAYWLWLGPLIIPAGVALIVAGVVLWAWTHVPHGDIARILGAVGGVLVAVYAARNVTDGGPRARMVSRAAGRARSAWHPLGAAGLILLVASYLVWRSL